MYNEERWDQVQYISIDIDYENRSDDILRNKIRYRKAYTDKQTIYVAKHVVPYNKILQMTNAFRLSDQRRVNGTKEKINTLENVYDTQN